MDEVELELEVVSKTTVLKSIFHMLPSYMFVVIAGDAVRLEVGDVH